MVLLGVKIVTNEQSINPISTDEDYHIACYFHDKLTEQFSHWKIKFDMTTFELKQYTHILQCGWSIYYQFGHNDDQPYMEVYSTHRMASDGYDRYFADGTHVSLPSFVTGYIVGKEDEFHAWNNSVAKVVYDKTTGILRGI